MIDLTVFFNSFFNWITSIFNNLLGYRVIVFGVNFSVLGVFIIVTVITMICSIFLRNAKW